MKITDGTGKGYQAKVNSKNRIEMFSITEPEDKDANKNGKVWSIYFTVTPAGANDYFFYFKNTGNVDLSITDIRVSSTVATKLFYEEVSGAPTYVTGTDAQVTARNIGKSSLPSATIKYDTDITNLTSEGVLFFEQCATVNTRYKLSTSSNIIVGQGQAVAFKRVAATGAIDCVVSLVELE